MNTLATAPVSTLLDRLFAVDEESRTDLHARMAQIPAEQRTAMMSSKTDYRTMYMNMKDAPLAVSRATGTLLYMLARTMDARSIVEFGTSFGISTLHLAAALRDNGGGRIITSEFEPSKADRARANIAEAGLGDLVEFREGDALDTLARDLPARIDLVLLDGAKGLYPEILALLEPHLRPGALILADNADWSQDYLAKVRSPAQGYLSVPFAEDVELSMRIG